MALAFAEQLGIRIGLTFMRVVSALFAMKIALAVTARGWRFVRTILGKEALVARPWSELKVPWFALAVGGVGIVENKRTPNYMFRVATNDREVAKFLVTYGLEKAGGKKFAILNEDSGWGVPAISDLQAALKERNLEPASADKMKVGDSDFTPQTLRAKNAGADTILSYSNAVEMANTLKAANKIG